MKSARQKKILDIISEHAIDTQEALIIKLREAGFNATQTTVSRDMNQLKLIKAIDPSGGYRYVAPAVGGGSAASLVINSALRDSVIKVEAAKNIVVVKTLSGMANAIAVCIDSLNHDDIVGSVAGDDTILLVIKSDELAHIIEDRLKNTFAVRS